MSQASINHTDFGIWQEAAEAGRFEPALAFRHVLEEALKKKDPEWVKEIWNNTPAALPLVDYRNSKQVEVESKLYAEVDSMSYSFLPLKSISTHPPSKALLGYPVGTAQAEVDAARSQSQNSSKI